MIRPVVRRVALAAALQVGHVDQGPGQARMPPAEDRIVAPVRGEGPMFAATPEQVARLRAALAQRSRPSHGASRPRADG